MSRYTYPCNMAVALSLSLLSSLLPPLTAIIIFMIMIL